jgi:uncharacterized repeat protein (TIGR01451 family)
VTDELADRFLSKDEAAKLLPADTELVPSAAFTMVGDEAVLLGSVVASADDSDAEPADGDEAAQDLQTLQLAPGETATVYAVHTVTQDDVTTDAAKGDDGSYKSYTLVNTASASGTAVRPAGVDESVALPDVDPGTDTAPAALAAPNPSLSVTKKVANQKTDADGKVVPFDLGDIVTYKITVENTGNVTLTNVTVAEGLADAVFYTVNINAGYESTTIDKETNTAVVASLAPGEKAEVNAYYRVTEQDVRNDYVTNAVTVKATNPEALNDPEGKPTVTEGGATNADALTDLPKGSVTLDETHDRAVETSTGEPMAPVDDELDDDMGVDAADAVDSVDVSTGTYAKGETVKFSMRIRNTSNVTLYNVTLANSLNDMVYDEDVDTTKTTYDEAYVNNGGATEVYDAADGTTVEVGANSVVIPQLEPNGLVTVYGYHTVTEDDLVSMKLSGTGVLDESSVTASIVPVDATDEQTVSDTSGAHAPVEEAQVSLNVVNEISRLTSDGLEEVTASNPLVLDDTAVVISTVVNDSNITLTDVKLTGEGLDGATTEFLTLNGSVFDYERDGDGVITIAQMAPGDEVVVYRTYVVTEPDVLADLVSDTAHAEGWSALSTDETVMALDSASAPTALPLAHLALTKAAVSEPEDGVAYDVGETVVYRVTAFNDGTLVLSNVTVSDLLAGAAFDEPGEGDDYTIDAEGNAVLGRLVPGQSAEFTVRYAVAAADVVDGSVTNTVTAAATTSDGDQTQVGVEPGSATVPAVDVPDEAETPAGDDQPADSDQPAGTEQPADSDQPVGTEQPATPDRPATAAYVQPTTAALPKTSDDTWSPEPLLALGACMLGASGLFLGLRRKELGRE